MVDSNVSIGTVCRKDNKNQQNQAPLYLRVAYDNQRKFLYLKERIDIDFWDFETNQIKSDYPNKEYLELTICTRKVRNSKLIFSLHRNSS